MIPSDSENGGTFLRIFYCFSRRTCQFLVRHEKMDCGVLAAQENCKWLKLFVVNWAPNWQIWSRDCVYHKDVQKPSASILFYPNGWVVAVIISRQDPCRRFSTGKQGSMENQWLFIEAHRSRERWIMLFAILSQCVVTWQSLEFTSRRISDAIHQSPNCPSEILNYKEILFLTSLLSLP